MLFEIINVNRLRSEIDLIKLNESEIYISIYISILCLRSGVTIEGAGGMCLKLL